LTFGGASPALENSIIYRHFLPKAETEVIISVLMNSIAETLVNAPRSGPAARFAHAEARPNFGAAKGRRPESASQKA
jgi:hypothetical protein